MGDEVDMERQFWSGICSNYLARPIAALMVAVGAA
jgi:hypothetical protein